MSTLPMFVACRKKVNLMCSMIRRRIFLVGCPRSGTTLLQRCIAAHPSVVSFPETDFFAKAIGRHGFLRSALGRIKPTRRLAAFRYLSEVLQDPGIVEQGEGSTSLQETIDRFVEVLDSRANGCSVWLEKTPKHFRYVEEIEKRVPDARFIHLVRDGRDVVASVLDLSSRYSGFERDGSLEAAINLWNEAVRTALRCRHKNHHVVISYEKFIKDPENILRGLCRFLGIDYVPEMITSTNTKNIVLDKEPWKSDVQQEIQQQISKFSTLLSDNEKRSVNQGLDWKAYKELFPDNVK